MAKIWAAIAWWTPPSIGEDHEANSALISRLRDRTTLDVAPQLGRMAQPLRDWWSEIGTIPWRLGVGACPEHLQHPKGRIKR
jgi:hypothetical protein